MIPSGLRIPRAADEFAACQAKAESAVDPAARLPDWPFIRPAGYVAIAQYERLLGTDFVPVLEALAGAYGDEDITLVVIEPDPSYYQQHYGHLPGFRVLRAGLGDGYWAGLSHEPHGDPTGAIAYTADVVAVVGSSGSWAVWGQRDWDLVLVHASTADDAWLKVDVPFVAPHQALEDFTALERSATPLTEAHISTFLRNLDAQTLGRSRSGAD